ncbi:protein phosphatase 2C domain-containing protein [Streptomyces sp. NPDC006235]|uniref:protein phosphatase 2C domain-containing protein n=1 Tax=Streptomyces sp. NPDC006235 TaxID=3156736 RepID=UPI0033A6D082
MSQQGGRPTGPEDDWWGQLYDDSTGDTGPTPAPDSLDDRFASAAGAVEGRSAPGAGAGERAVSEPVVPAPRAGADDLLDTPRASRPSPQRAPWEPPPARPTGPVTFPTTTKRQGPEGTPPAPPTVPPPPPTPPFWPSPEATGSTTAGAAPRGPTAPAAEPRPGAADGTAAEPDDAEPSGTGPEETALHAPGPGGTASPAPADRSPAPARPVDPPLTPPAPAGSAPASPPSRGPVSTPPPPVGSASTSPPPVGSGPTPPPPAGSPPTSPPSGGSVSTPPPPPVDAPFTPPPPVGSGPTPPAPLGSGPTPPPPAGSAPTSRPSGGSVSTPPPPVGSAPTSPPTVGSGPTPPPPVGSPLAPPPPAGSASTPPPPPDSPPPPADLAPDQSGSRFERPVSSPPARGHVGSRPPTYDAEPTALPLADPDDLDDLVADTVLDGARYGACTLRAVSVRGDSARYRGEPRRDSLLTARFGTGEQALLLVAMATGARARPGAHRAAAEACHWIGRAVGRSHARLVEDIRAGRRGDLKSGLHRLTDRSLGKLRASAAEQGVDPEEYAAGLRCLLLPADPECRTRVFFGVGPGGLFRLRDGEWQDIEPQVAEIKGEPVVGFGSPPSETPDGDRLTMDLGIPTPPSPYEPAPEPPREPFRFRTSVARPGDTLLVCSAGLADPLRGEPELGDYLAERWSRPEPPGLAAFLADSQVRVKGYADDRTAAAVWEA